MEGAFLLIIGAMAILIVEITVMKMDVSDGRWVDKAHIIWPIVNLSKIKKIVYQSCVFLCFNKSMSYVHYMVSLEQIFF